MLGESITVTINAVAKVLKKINGGENYATEYLLRETDGEYRMKIRHSKDKGLTRGEIMDRHNVELTRTVFGTSPDDGYSVVVSSTIRNPERIGGVEVDQISDGLCTFVAANGVLLAGWES